MANTRLTQQGSIWILQVKNIRHDRFATGLELASDHVVVEAFRPNPSIMWNLLELQLAPDVPTRSIIARDLRLDLRLTKSEFLDLASTWRVGGVNAWFMARPCPDTLRVLDLPSEKRYQILATMGFSLEFVWPQPAVSDWAHFATPRRELVDRLESVFGE